MNSKDTTEKNKNSKVECEAKKFGDDIEEESDDERALRETKELGEKVLKKMSDIFTGESDE